MDVLELLFTVPIAPSKIATLEQMSVKIDLLKILLRLAKDTKALSSGRYIELQSALQEIGKMLGGWLRASKKE